MNAPQIIVLVIIGAEVGIVLAKHGRPREGTHSVHYSVISAAIWLGLLYWGEFFN